VVSANPRVGASEADPRSARGASATNASPDLRRQPWTVSQLSLFRVVLVFRWLTLILLPLQEGVGHPASLSHTLWFGIAIGAAYTLVLTLFSRRISGFHLRNWTFSFIDMGILFAVYFATGTGTSWPFFVFSTSTVLMIGLRGTLASGLVSAIVWSLLTMMAWAVKGVPIGEAFGISAFDDLFNVTLMGAIWSYGVGLAAGLRRAEQDLSDSRRAISEANASLLEREHELAGILDVTSAIIARTDPMEVLSMVRGALGDLGFGRSRVWLLQNGWLVSDSSSGGLPWAAAQSRPFVERAMAGGEMVVIEPGSPGATTEPAGSAVLSIAVPIVAKDETFGALVVESASGETFTPRDRELLDLFAGQIALALRHVRFYECARDRATADERRRLAREIRATACRALSEAAGIADRLARRDSGCSPAVREKAGRVAEALRIGMRDLDASLLG
jgi:GAF domain-containing protein